MCLIGCGTVQLDDSIMEDTREDDLSSANKGHQHMARKIKKEAGLNNEGSKESHELLGPSFSNYMEEADAFERHLADLAVHTAR